MINEQGLREIIKREDIEEEEKEDLKIKDNNGGKSGRLFSI